MSAGAPRLFVVDDAAPEPFEGDLPSAYAGFQARSSVEGAEFKQVAFELVEQAGGAIVRASCDVADVRVDALVRGRNGRDFVLLAHGNFDDGPKAGLRRVDTLHKAGHRAFMLHAAQAPPVIVVASHLPVPGTKAATYLARTGVALFDVVGRHDLAGFHRLRRYLTTVPPPSEPEPTPWREEHRQGRFAFDVPGRDDA